MVGLGARPSPLLSSQLVVWNRIEQGLLCSALVLAFWWLARLVLKRQWLSAVITACFAVLWRAV